MSETGTKESVRKVKMLQSSANGLKRDCPIGHAEMGVMCYSSSPFICAKRRSLFKVNKPSKYVTVTFRNGKATLVDVS